MSSKRGKRSAPLITDRKLPERLQGIITSNSAIVNDDEKLIDVLRTKYPEYRRKNASALISLITWARGVISSNTNTDTTSSSPTTLKRPRTDENYDEQPIELEDNEVLESTDHIDVSDDEIEEVDKKPTPTANIANSAIRNLYKTPFKFITDTTSPATTNQPTTTIRPTNSTTMTQSNPPSAVPAVRPQSNSSATSQPSSANPGPRKRARVQAAVAASLNDQPPSEAPVWQPEFTVSKTSYADLGGIEAILQDIHELIEYPLSHPELYNWLGVEPPRGVLLHGPPGAGKTALAHAIAGELARFNVKFLSISAPEIVSGMSGESEAKIRALFALAKASSPCLIFIDEIDAITSKRADAQRAMESRIVAQMLTAMDSLKPDKKTHSDDPADVDENASNSGMVIVIGATNRPDSLDPALRRAGRFDREISVPIPDESAREQILRVMCRDMRVQADMEWPMIAQRAVGYVGADIAALTREAAVIAVNRIFRSKPKLLEAVVSAPAVVTETSSDSMDTSDGVASENGTASLVDGVEHVHLTDATQSTALTVPAPSQRVQHAAELQHRSAASSRLRSQNLPLTSNDMRDLFIEQTDFVQALTKVQPSSKREGFASVPDVRWSDIGALDALRDELTMHVMQPIKNPAQFEALGLHVPAGVLLFGPPGCGKTLVAKAIAAESGASFVSVKGPELLNAFVGQSEKAVRRVFERARASAPCVIFFDELDALCPRRGSGMSSEGSHVSERVVNQLLTEMDGVNERKQVFVLAATNRPDMIDPAMLRPGRLEKLLYVPLPNMQDRCAILDKQLLRTPLDVNDQQEKTLLVHQIASDARCDRFSGADCAALAREAAIAALREAQRAMPLRTENDSAPTVLQVKVGWRHFDDALNRVQPSVSKEAERRYNQMLGTLRKARATLEPQASESKSETSA